MNVFKKIFRYFFRFRDNVLEKEGAHILFYRKGRILKPKDVLEYLTAAVSMSEAELVKFSMSDIRVFNLYSKENHNFIGTCYIVEKNNRYYGGLVGDDSIFICSKDNFIFRKTDKVSVPLKKTESEEFTLFCSLDINKGCMQLLYIVKTCNQESDKRVEVVRFTADYPLDQAIRYCAEEGFL